MTDHIFEERTFVRIETDPPSWLVVEAGRTLATLKPFSTFLTFADAVAAGFDGEEPDPEKPDLRAAALAKLQTLGLTEAEALALIGG